MCLVDEADLGGDVGERLPAQDPVARGIESPTDHVAMGRDAKRLAEGARKLGRPSPNSYCGCGQCDRFEQVVVQMFAKVLGEGRLGSAAWLGRLVAQGRPDGVGDAGELHLRLERVVATREQFVKD